MDRKFVISLKETTEKVIREREEKIIAELHFQYKEDVMNKLLDTASKGKYSYTAYFKLPLIANECTYNGELSSAIQTALYRLGWDDKSMTIKSYDNIPSKLCGVTIKFDWR